MRQTRNNRWGFTIVELLVVILVIAILAVLVIVAYNGVQRRAAEAVTRDALRQASNAITVNAKGSRATPTGLPSNYITPSSLEVTLTAISTQHYSGLSSVQNGVLFYDVCKDLVTNPQYSTIHAQSGGGTSNVVMSCNDNIYANGLQITGWETKTWTVPLARSTVQAYIDSVPYDSWWTDKQSVVRGFYTALITEFTVRGGSWPVQSFWDPWANQWSGVKKQELPTPDKVDASEAYCIMAKNIKYPDIIYHTIGTSTIVLTGGC